MATFTLHDAFAAAEDAWQTMLDLHFGNDARHARYDHRGRGDEGSTLRAVYEARRDAFLACYPAKLIDKA